MRPEQPDLVARRIADIEISLFASTDYLNALGPVGSLAEFSKANFIGYEHPERLIPQITAMGIPVTKANFGITTSNGSAMYELVREGAGIAFLPTIVAEGRLGVQKIRPDAPMFNMETWLVTHRGKFRPVAGYASPLIIWQMRLHRDAGPIWWPDPDGCQSGHRNRSICSLDNS